jgi:hypothetical protein
MVLLLLLMGIFLGWCPFGIQALFDLHFNWVVMQVDVKNILISFIELLFLKSLIMLKGF